MCTNRFSPLLQQFFVTQNRFNTFVQLHIRKKNWRRQPGFFKLCLAKLITVYLHDLLTSLHWRKNICGTKVLMKTGCRVRRQTCLRAMNKSSISGRYQQSATVYIIISLKSAQRSETGKAEFCSFLWYYSYREQEFAIRTLDPSQASDYSYLQ